MKILLLVAKESLPKSARHLMGTDVCSNARRLHWQGTTGRDRLVKVCVCANEMAIDHRKSTTGIGRDPRQGR